MSKTSSQPGDTHWMEKAPLASPFGIQLPGLFVNGLHSTPLLPTGLCDTVNKRAVHIQF